MKICCDTSFLLTITEKRPDVMRRLDRARNRHDTLVIPKIAMAELLVVLFRRGKASLFDSMTREIGDYAEIDDMTDETMRLSAKLVHSGGVSLVDSIIFATGEAAGCRILLTKDMRDMKRLEELAFCSMLAKGFD